MNSNRPIRKRQVVATANKAQSTYSDLVDLSYLPQEYVERIDKIFDSYFYLGMKKSSWTKMQEDNAPQFPNKLSSLSSPQIGDELGKYTAWYSFASDKLKYVSVACNFIEQELQRVFDLELGKLYDDKGNVELKKAKARSSEEYILIQSYAQKLRGVKVLLEQEMEGYDKCISTLSREVSRRENNAGF